MTEFFYSDEAMKKRFPGVRIWQLTDLREGRLRWLYAYDRSSVHWRILFSDGVFRVD